MKTYSGHIKNLKSNQVFVFGSNLKGFHGAGAAGFASFGKSGNVWRDENYDQKKDGWMGRWNVKGVGEGYQRGRDGRSYAIPTIVKPGLKRSIRLEQIKQSVAKLYKLARIRPNLEFLVAYSTKKGLSGYSVQEIASCFSGDIPDNMIFEKGFGKLI